MSVLRILLAEDNRGDVLLVRQALREHGIEHELSVVSDGAEAAVFISQIGKLPSAIPPDLLLLDLNLPKLDGQQVLHRFRQNPECADRPVIVVTSSDSSSDRARMAALGISYYFRKPSDFDEFMSLGTIIRDVIART